MGRPSHKAPGFSIDSSQTPRIWARENALIDPHDFDCRYYDRRNGSVVGGHLWRGKGCQMSYIGRHYGSCIAEENFRLMLVGIDHGEKGGADFDEMRGGVEPIKGIEDWYQNGGCKFNPDYKGLVKTAAAVFGVTGEYCQTHCTASCQRSRNPGAAQCVIDQSARPNIVNAHPRTRTVVNRGRRGA
jgi:hypothetical protein